jgi:predicted acyl esterase
MTVGYVDSNTNVGGGAVDYFNALAGPKRMWIGWWDHVRGNDMVGDELAMGRAGFFAEVMRFYDQHLKGIAPKVKDPVVAAQGSDGRWTAETSWPARDTKALVTPLKAGSYQDDATNLGSNDSAAGVGGSGAIGDAQTGAGAWTFSPPLPSTARLAGIPSAAVGLAPLAPRTNVVVNVYDVAPDGTATMITRGAGTADAAGSSRCGCSRPTGPSRRATASASSCRAPTPSPTSTCRPARRDGPAERSAAVDAAAARTATAGTSPGSRATARRRRSRRTRRWSPTAPTGFRCRSSCQRSAGGRRPCA